MERRPWVALWAGLGFLLLAMALVAFGQVGPPNVPALGKGRRGITSQSGGTVANPFLTSLVASWSTLTFTAATNVITAWANDTSTSCGATCDLAPTASPTVTGGATGLAVNLVAASAQDLSAADNTTLSIASNTDFGLCAWIQPAAVTTVGIVGKSAAEYQLSVDGTSHLTFTVADSVAGTSVATTTGTLTASLRTFVCGWYTSADKKAHASIDAGTAADGSALSNGPADAANAFIVEGDQNGSVDSLVFYKGAVPGVTALYNSDKGGEVGTAGTGSLVCGWDLDETSGTRSSSAGTGGAACDLSAVNAPGVVAGLVETTDALGNTSLGMQVVGASTQYVSVADNAFLSASAGTAMAWCYWVNPQSVTGIQMHLVKDATTAREYLSFANGTLVSVFGFQTDVTNATVNTAAILAIGSWDFVCAWWDPADGKMYVSNNGAAPTASAGTITGIQDDTAAFSIGDRPGGATSPATATFANVLVYKAIPDYSGLYAAGVGLYYDFAWQLFMQDPARMASMAFRALFDPWQTFSRDAEKRPYAGA